MDINESEADVVQSCPNCGQQLHGSFCFHCGQNQRNLNRLFFTLVSETFEDVFSLNSRASLTVFHLFFKPGFSTEEYSKGRRARYVAPLRLYIVTSIIFVLFLSVQNILDPDMPDDLPIIINGDPSLTQALNEADQRPKITDNEAAQKIETIVNKLQFDWLAEEQAEELRQIAKQQARKAYQIFKDDPSQFSAIILDTLPPLMFVLLPIFALLLKLTYLTSNRYYTEHLVFALHNHSFLYLAFILIQLLNLITEPIWLAGVFSSISSIISLWIPIYLILSLKSFYQQGVALTLFKTLFLSMSYSFLLTLTLFMAILWGFFTL
jgi:hypothetical protein